jgi:hypothetical protein
MGNALHLNLAQSFVAISTTAAAWLMVRAGTAKGVLKAKTADRCASCGRLRNRGRCQCTASN